MDGSDILTLWIIVAWLGLAVLVGWSATQKGRGGAPWFFLSLVFSPFFTVLALIACPAVAPATQEVPAPVAVAGGSPDFYRPYRMTGRKPCPIEGDADWTPHPFEAKLDAGVALIRARMGLAP